MSIKNTLRKTLIICSTVPLIFVSILAYFLNTSRLLNVQKDTLWQIAKTNSTGLESLILTQVTELSLLSVQANVTSLLLNNPSLDKTKEQYINYSSIYSNKLLSDRVNSHKACINITLFTKNKEVISSSNKDLIWHSYRDSATLSYLSITKKPVIGISGLIKTTTKDDEIVNYIEIGVPVLHPSNSDEIIGYIISDIDVNYFKDYIDSLSLNSSGQSYIVNNKGQILYHKDKEKIGMYVKSKEIKNLVTNFSKGNLEQSSTLTFDEDKEKTLYGYSVIPELDWVLLVGQNVNDIINLANINLTLIISTTCLAVVILMILSNFIAMKYTKPIIQLRDAMLVASKGNLDVQVNFKSITELIDLSKCFNKMIHIIKANYDELTQVHQELIIQEDELREYCKQIEYLAYHDSLTGLPNKLAFTSKLTRRLVRSNTEHIHGVYYIDIDNFKNINDTLGYEFGDAILIEAAKRIKKIVSSTDVVSKVGGDEFLVFIKHIESKAHSELFGNRIREIFLEPFHIEGEILYLSVSVGYSLYPICGTTPTELIRQADIAMYQSKFNGKDSLTLFESAMETEILRKNEIISVLRESIDKGEVYVHYQPQVNIMSNEIIGFEALMRVKSERLGYLSPAEFIPIAEETGLILPLGEWILTEACNFTRRLQSLGLKGHILSVNISPIQLNHPNFITMVKDVLKNSGLSPKYLELEITESTIVNSLETSKAKLFELIDLGVRISLDDFGTGYSSLNYLTSMPIHTLKIDKSFINNITRKEKDSFIAETIIRLAHLINVNVIAEGVEYTEQLDILKAKKCDIVQGYLFSKPLSEVELIDFFAK